MAAAFDSSLIYCNLFISVIESISIFSSFLKSMLSLVYLGYKDKGFVNIQSLLC